MLLVVFLPPNKLTNAFIEMFEVLAKLLRNLVLKSRMTCSKASINALELFSAIFSENSLKALSCSLAASFASDRASFICDSKLPSLSPTKALVCFADSSANTCRISNGSSLLAASNFSGMNNTKTRSVTAVIKPRMELKKAVFNPASKTGNTLIYCFDIKRQQPEKDAKERACHTDSRQQTWSNRYQAALPVVSLTTERGKQRQ